MVIRRLFTLVLLTLWALPAFAQNTLIVESSRTELYETETLTLTVKGSMELSMNPGGLFDLSLSNLPPPDTRQLEQNFKILSRDQQYSMRTYNGMRTGDITWTYHLAPLSSGELEIPPLTFKGAISSAHTITVKPGSPTQTGTSGQQAFIELATDKDSVYVQEQLILTVRLFFSGNLLRGELSEPSHANALIEPLGKQREYRRFQDGREYRVVERRYAIFPQQTGNFALDPIEFQGQMREPSGPVQFLRDSASFFDVPVKAPPASFSGNTWLPASSLNLTETGIPDPLSLQQGENLTRTLTLTAGGLAAEALPQLSITGTDALKSYPEQPQRSTDLSPDGITGTLVSATALVGVTAGTTTLAEIRLPWWDTTTDSEELAVIPAKTITILGTTPTNDSAAQKPIAADNISQVSASADNSARPVAGNVWLWIAAITGAGWFVTATLWAIWAIQHREPAPESTRMPDPGEQELYADVVAAAKKGDIRIFSLLPQWMNMRGVPTRTFNSVKDVLEWAKDEGLNAEIHQLERRAFDAEQQETASPWDGQGLIKALKRLRARKPAAHTPAKDELLPPLYPETLTDRN